MITLEDVKKARERISGRILRTPLLRVPALDPVLGCQVYLKPENLQLTGSFKIRGAMNAVLSLTEEEKENAFVQGMEKVYKQLMTTLEGIEVKPIEAVGKEFDPNFHNAVMHVEDENLGENIVAEEFQKGYMYRDSVVRHSMVKVAN